MPLVIFIILSFLVFVTCSAEHQERNELKIGAILHLTRDQAAQGNALKEGIEIALAKINQNNTCGGTKIKIIYEDSQLKPIEAHKAATRLIHQHKITAALNSSFLEAMANGSVFEQAKIPVITLWDSSPLIDDIGEYVFGIGTWTPSAAEAAADFALAKLKSKSLAIVSMQNEWSQSVADIFGKKVAAAGSKVLFNESLSTTTADFRTIITKIRQLKPDVLYSPITDNVVAFYTQLKELGFEGKVISSDIITSGHIQQRADIFEGIYQTQAHDPGNEQAKMLIKFYKDTYGSSPKYIALTALGFDGLNILCEAVKRSGSKDSSSLKNELYKIANFAGASHNITFNEKGSAPIREQMFVVREGELAAVTK